jgi:hypothetical protein
MYRSECRAEMFMRVNRSVSQSLYESIKTEPFKIPEDDGNDLMHTFFNPDKEGWLWKQGEFPLNHCPVCNLHSVPALSS